MNACESQIPATNVVRVDHSDRQDPRQYRVRWVKSSQVRTLDIVVVATTAIVAGLLGLVSIGSDVIANEGAGLSVDDIEHLLRAGVTQHRVVALIQDRGITFELTEPLKERLKRSGAGPELIEAVMRTSTRRGETRVQMMAAEREQRSVREERLKAEEERRGAEMARRRAQEELREAQEEEGRAEVARKRAEEERRGAEQERERTEQSWRATQKQRGAETYPTRLPQLGDRPPISASVVVPLASDIHTGWETRTLRLKEFIFNIRSVPRPRVVGQYSRIEPLGPGRSRVLYVSIYHANGPHNQIPDLRFSGELPGKKVSGEIRRGDVTIKFHCEFDEGGNVKVTGIFVQP